MRQILYTSTSLIGSNEQSLHALLGQCRASNALEGVTGLLWTDGFQFAQVLEGGEEAVWAAMQRIRSDGRHHNIAVVEDHLVERCQFGEWSMLMPRGDALAVDFEQRMLNKLAGMRGYLPALFANIILSVDDTPTATN